jgi:type I restriction enzyme, S subunit
MSRSQFTPFESAFLDVPVGKRKLSEAEYKPRGNYAIVDQGKTRIAGYTDDHSLVRSDVPLIVFGDHTRIVKLVDFPFVVGADGVRLYRPAEDYEADFLFYFLRAAKIPQDGYGRHSKYLSALQVPILPKQIQWEISHKIREHLSLADQARLGLVGQLAELSAFANSLITESVQEVKNKDTQLGGVLSEVNYGIGGDWRAYPVLGATRNGLAPAKERPGKYPERYKPVTAGTVFYNPMRILIGSIAFVDDDDEPGITSPDYVVLKGKPGVVDSRWFYYWLRSPLGERCIQSLARGAVRERMLFNRLAEGRIELPDYDTQVKASKALAQIKPMGAAIKQQLAELELLPQKLLAQVFKA